MDAPRATQPCYHGETARYTSHDARRIIVHVDREKALKHQEAVDKLNQIIASDAPLDEKIEQALTLGNDYLGTTMAIISRVDRLLYHVYRQASPPDTLTDGQTFPLGITYCQVTLERNRLVAVNQAGRSVFTNHPAYKEMGLETYIGVPLRDASGKRLGTLNFSAPEKRPQPFTREHEQFMACVANWLAPHLVETPAYVRP